MEVKFGKVRPRNNIFINASSNLTDANFFASNNQQKEQKQGNSGTGTRFNDYDSKILEDNAYRDIPDEMFQLEHKIQILEENLSKINNEIETLESFGYHFQLTAVKDRKKKIEKELEQANEEYANLGLSAKFSEQITSAVKFGSRKKHGILSRINEFIVKQILVKISKKFNCNQFMKEALSSLSGINLSVDELVNLKIPYGETDSRYEKLTAYLNKANVIHSQISKNVNAITKPQTQEKKQTFDPQKALKEAATRGIKPPSIPIQQNMPIRIKGKL